MRHLFCGIKMKKNILKTVSGQIQKILKKDKKIEKNTQTQRVTQRQKKNRVKPEEKTGQKSAEKVIQPEKHRAIKEKEENNRTSWVDCDYDAMDGEEFEYFCARLLRVNGFADVEMTKRTGDLGVDILARKDQITYAVQCKCHMSNIGNQAVRDVYSGKECYHCMVGVVMTNRFFTKAAEDLAREHNVLLWDRNQLQRLIQNAKKQVYAVGKEIAAGEYWIFGEQEKIWKGTVSRDQEGKSILFQIVSEGKYIVEVKSGEYLILEEAQFCPVGSLKKAWENNGWFAVKVGRELEPGAYRLSAADEEVSAYYAVYRSARYIEKEKLQSDFFEDQTFVTVEAGTYLVGENCYCQKIGKKQFP